MGSERRRRLARTRKEVYLKKEEGGLFNDESDGFPLIHSGTGVLLASLALRGLRHCREASKTPVPE